MNDGHQPGLYTIDLTEEIARDSMDAEGDRQRGSRSVVILKLLLWGALGLAYRIPKQHTILKAYSKAQSV